MQPFTLSVIFAWFILQCFPALAVATFDEQASLHIKDNCRQRITVFIMPITSGCSTQQTVLMGTEHVLSLIRKNAEGEMCRYPLLQREKSFYGSDEDLFIIDYG